MPRPAFKAEKFAASFLASLVAHLEQARPQRRAAASVLQATAGMLQATAGLVYSEASCHLISEKDAEPGSREHVLGQQVSLQTIPGVLPCHSSGRLAAGELGDVDGIVVPREAPSAVFLGQLVAEPGLSFSWDAHRPDDPALTTRDGKRIPLHAKHNVPTTRNDAPRPRSRSRTLLATIWCAPSARP